MRPQRRAHMFLEDLRGEDVSGQTAKEVEHVFYGKVADANQLVDLAKQPFVTKVLQEQYQFKIDNASKTTVRVRRLNRKDCVLTFKTFVEGQEGMDETTLECTPEMFEIFSKLSGEGINKMRYTIKPEGWERPLELDVFVTASGNMTPFAKYDYEVSSESDKVPPFPVALSDLKHVNPYRSTDEERQALRQWMNAQSFKV